jgi:hypothetical protein
MWFESDEFSKMKKKQSAFGELVRYPFTVFITEPYGDPIFHRIEVKQDLTTVKIFFSNYDVYNGQLIKVKIIENPEFTMWKFKKQFP